MRTTMSSGRVLAVAVAATVGWAVAIVPAAAAEGDLTLASATAAGIPGNSVSDEPSLSADGTLVAFHSYASNLVEGGTDDDDAADVFVKNLVSGEVTLVSAKQDGMEANGNSFYSSLSADGTHVAFSTDATNLAAGDTDTKTDIYVKNLLTGELTLASVDENGAKADDDSNRPSLSADGSRVAFWSYAANWVAGDAELTADVFVKDLVSGDLILASADSTGTRGDGHSDSASLSADGTRVAFHSLARNLVEGDTNNSMDVFVKNLLTGTVTLASAADDGTKGDSYSGLPSLSADGTRVAFESTADNLGEGATETIYVYVKDLVSGELTLASTDENGHEGTRASKSPSLSSDGFRVAFYSNADDLVEADPDTTSDVYVKDLVSQELTLASTAEDGTKGNGFSQEPSLSGDGSRVAFSSVAINLGEGDTDGYTDVYVKTVAAPVDPPPPPDPAPTCEGREATVYVSAAGLIVGGPDAGQPYAGQLRGTDGPDVIVGTPQADSVLAAGGDDLVCALGGGDTAYGGAGADRLLGNDGPDRLSGNNGRDTLVGGYGNDRLTGGTQADRFNGGPQQDTATDYSRAQGDTITAVP
jgi:Tol biopolymer transport system component